MLHNATIYSPAKQDNQSESIKMAKAIFFIFKADQNHLI